MYVTLVQFLSCLMRNEYEAAQILCKKGKDIMIEGIVIILSLILMVANTQ